MIRKFNSIRDMVDFARSLGINSTSTTDGGSWYNNESSFQTFEFATNGNLTQVAPARALLSQLETKISTPKRVWKRAPVGVYCAIPEFIAGFPTPMRRMVRNPNDHSPINIYVCTTSSAGINAATLTKRGTVILALVLALIRSRPTRLHLLSTLDGHRDNSGEMVITVPIPTAPLDLARACYALTSAGFDRRLNHKISEKLNDYRGHWPDAAKTGWSYTNPKPYYDKLIVRLGADPKSTLIIPSSQLYDQLLSAPIDWIKHQINRFNPQQHQEG
jgi:hypothetical protein